MNCTYKIVKLGVSNVKAINLLSLLSARNDLVGTNFLKYIEQFGMNTRIRMSELDDLQTFVNSVIRPSRIYELVNHYFVGFMINRIGKEFDLLRIGENSVINIELKRESNDEKIKRQLVQNDYYLKFLDVPIHNFTFISSTKKLYRLVNSKDIVEVEYGELIEKLKEQKIREIEDLNRLFDPTNYLVSPFNSPELFIEDKYFLSAQQSTYKREIIQLKPQKQSVIISIEGGPGTGKSLLTYDIAKEYMKQSKKIKIYNCGKLHKGHDLLIQKYNWPIEQISNFQLQESDRSFQDYEVLIFDEAQRLYKQKFFKLIEMVQHLKMKCIFSYDRNQVLTRDEIESNIPSLIEQLHTHKYELTTIFRHNKEINTFIKNLFDLSRRGKVEHYENISIQYFSSKESAKGYLYYMKLDGWKVIDYTISNYIEQPDNDHSKESEKSKELPGHEFDHVVAVLDEYFYYNSQGKMATKDVEDSPYYQPSKMLYQNISRTRKKLHLVIINNPEVMEKILRILH